MKINLNGSNHGFNFANKAISKNLFNTTQSNIRGYNTIKVSGLSKENTAVKLEISKEAKLKLRRLNNLEKAENISKVMTKEKFMSSFVNHIGNRLNEIKENLEFGKEMVRVLSDENSKEGQKQMARFNLGEMDDLIDFSAKVINPKLMDQIDPSQTLTKAFDKVKSLILGEVSVDENFNFLQVDSKSLGVNGLENVEDLDMVNRKLDEALELIDKQIEFYNSFKENFEEEVLSNGLENFKLKNSIEVDGKVLDSMSENINEIENMKDLISKMKEDT